MRSSMARCRSSPGWIEVRWLTEQRDSAWHLRFDWREHGRQIDDRSPKKGFGARVIEDSLPYILGGTSRLTFHPDGVECVIEFPLPHE